MNLTRRHLLVLTVLSALILAAGCSERDPTGLPVARAPIDPLVFADDYGEDVYPQPWAGTYQEAVSVDSTTAFRGAASLKITVPTVASALFTGGVLTSVGARDFADYNALTFYAKSSVACQVNTLGFGNDNTGNSLYGADRTLPWGTIRLTTDWEFFVVPIPLAEKLVAERGLFTFAEAPETDEGYDMWFDDIRFAKLDNITDPLPVLPSQAKAAFIGETINLGDTYTRFSVDGGIVYVYHSPNYYDFVSSDASVAYVDGSVIRLVGEGDATITATMGVVDVMGEATLSGYIPPTVAATPPTVPAQNVTSVFSDVYTDIAVDSWLIWSPATVSVSDYVIAGDNTKMYNGLPYAIIQFLEQPVDATDMTHLHIDVFAPGGTAFMIKLAAFDNSKALLEERLLSFDATTTPAFVAGQWSSLEIPMEDFGFTVAIDQIGQLILDTPDAKLALVDNIYWHR